MRRRTTFVPKENYLLATYNITTLGYNQILSADFDISQVKELWVNGVKSSTIGASYYFSSTGTKTIKYVFEHDGFITGVNMFQDCTTLKTADMTNLSGEFCKSLTGMFIGCTGVTTIDFTGFDATNITSTINMFNSCTSLISLKFGDKFTPVNLTDVRNMFHYCTKLTTLDMRHFDFSKVTQWGYTWARCFALTSLYLNTSVNSTFKSATNWMTDNTAAGTLYYNAAKMSTSEMPTLPTSWKAVAYNY